MSFESLANVAEPGRAELKQFVVDVRESLAFVLDSGDFAFLWEGTPELRDEARETFSADVAEHGVPALIGAVDDIPQAALLSHGLSGRPLRFKFRVLDFIARHWGHVRQQLSARDWFKKIIDAIDAILDSLIDAASGVGGIIKEFKDALAALA